MAKKVKKIIKTAAGQLGGHDQRVSAPDPGRPTETKPGYVMEYNADGTLKPIPPEFLKSHEDGEEVSMGHDRPNKISPKYKTKAPR